MTMRAQSAMEYLTTYGWALVVIVVVVISLISLNVFNVNGIGPKAQPGACQVQRPYGSGTVQFINLIGTCNGELPQFAAYFNGNTAVGNVPASSTLTTPFSSNAITLSGWFKVYKMPASGFAPVLYFGSTGASYCSPADLQINPPSTIYAQVQQIAGSNSVSVYNSVLTNTWYNAALTFTSNGAISLYLNGQLANTVSTTAYLDTPGQVYNLDFGSNLGTASSGSSACGGGPYYFNGTMANVQLYNTALSANDITALYQEGIGGAPIDLQHIQGWWQLNQNINDYSGNLENGTTANVVWLANWQSGYTTP
ncbi:MAG: hypothetical protein KGH60_02625 [Candidatus Micrarchaeota archaeon]|nr:hypothetical protein [Candidatus Micrarchaeota archaeon]